MQDAHNDNIRLLELRYSPQYIRTGHENLTLEGIHNAVLRGLSRASEKFHVGGTQPEPVLKLYPYLRLGQWYCVSTSPTCRWSCFCGLLPRHSGTDRHIGPPQHLERGKRGDGLHYSGTSWVVLQEHLSLRAFLVTRHSTRTPSWESIWRTTRCTTCRTLRLSFRRFVTLACYRAVSVALSLPILAHISLPHLCRRRRRRGCL